MERERERERERARDEGVYRTQSLTPTHIRVCMCAEGAINR